MNESKVNKPIERREQSGKASNVSTFVKREEKVYLRSYVMTEGKRRRWLQNFMPGKEDEIMFPSKRIACVEDAVTDPERREKAKLLLICLAIAFFLLLLIPIAHFTVSHLVIEEIRVEGDSLYSAQELLEAGGMDMGGNMPLFNANTAEERVCSSLPYVQSCNISFELPNILIFNVTDECAAMYTEIYGEFYALSKSLRVLERKESADGFAELLYVEIPQVKRAVVGEQILLEDDVNGEFIGSFLELIEASDLKDRLDIVYFDKKFDIVASIDNKYRVLFGSPADMPLKIATVSKIIEDNADECTSCGIIDVRVVEIAGIILNTDIDPNVRE